MNTRLQRQTKLQEKSHTRHKQYGANVTSLYLIRPDGCIGFRSQPIEIEPLLKYLNHLFLLNRDQRSQKLKQQELAFTVYKHSNI